VRALGMLLIVCVALAVVKAAIAALLLALVIALIWAACIHPRETFGLLTYCAVIAVFNAHPFTCFAIAGAVFVTAHVLDGKKNRHSQNVGLDEPET